MNRASSERLAQAETLWAMLDPRRYPAAKFEQAWTNVLLYSEHTWGAYCSISQPATVHDGPVEYQAVVRNGGESAVATTA